MYTHIHTQHASSTYTTAHLAVYTISAIRGSLKIPRQQRVHNHNVG